MGAYAKPIGYRIMNSPGGYKIFNDYPSALYYSPNRPRRSFPYFFTAAPDNGSGISIPGFGIFTFTWGGAPGAGIIPLVGGGGTADQAATAAQVALSAQLPGWSVTNPSAATLVLMSPPGTLPTVTLLLDPNMDLGSNGAFTFAGVVPGRFGQNYCFMAGTP